MCAASQVLTSAHAYFRRLSGAKTFDSPAIDLAISRGLVFVKASLSAWISVNQLRRSGDPSKIAITEFGCAFSNVVLRAPLAHVTNYGRAAQ